MASKRSSRRDVIRQVVRKRGGVGTSPIGKPAIAVSTSPNGATPSEALSDRIILPGGDVYLPDRRRSEAVCTDPGAGPGERTVLAEAGE